MRALVHGRHLQGVKQTARSHRAQNWPFSGSWGGGVLGVCDNQSGGGVSVVLLVGLLEIQQKLRFRVCFCVCVDGGQVISRQ